MTLTIDLTPEETARLRALAEAHGTDESGAIRELLDAALPKTGAELLQRMQEEGLINPAYGDPDKDGADLARDIREGTYPPREEKVA